jgi:hypothetical protein
MPGPVTVGWRGVAAALSCGGVIAGVTACSGAASSNSAASSPSAAASRPAPATGDPLAERTGDQVASLAIADFKTVSSVHVAGSGVDSGSTITVNLTLGTQECAGTLGISRDGSFQILKIGNAVWVKLDNRFWKYAVGNSIPAAVLAVLSGKYIRTSAKSSLKSLEMFCDPRQFSGAFADHSKGLVKGDITTVLGQPALPLEDKANSSTAYVTDSARPQFLRIVDGDGGRLDFTGYGASISLTPPPAAETIDGARYGF